jgi:hypothetical protein
MFPHDLEAPAHAWGFFSFIAASSSRKPCYRGLARGSVVVSRGAIARPARLPYGRADAASKTIGLHKLLHCLETPEQARWGHVGIKRIPGYFLCGNHRRHRFHCRESGVARPARVKWP